MKIIRCALLALTLVVAACENEKKEPEVEVSLDEEKLGRETDKNVLLETRKLVDESIVQKDQELVSALPSSSSEEAEESTVRIEITAGGKLYGSRGENRSLLAEKVTDSSLEQAKAWLNRSKAELQNLVVELKIDGNLPPQSVTDLMYLLAELEIKMATFVE